MTASEVIEICRQKADELNVPWNSKTAAATRRRVWPFAAYWRVVSIVHENELAVAMKVSERTRQAIPIRAHHHANHTHSHLRMF